MKERDREELFHVIGNHPEQFARMWAIVTADKERGEREREDLFFCLAQSLMCQKRIWAYVARELLEGKYGGLWPESFLGYHNPGVVKWVSEAMDLVDSVTRFEIAKKTLAMAPTGVWSDFISLAFGGAQWARDVLDAFIGALLRGGCLPVPQPMAELGAYAIKTKVAYALRSLLIPKTVNDPRGLFTIEPIEWRVENELCEILAQEFVDDFFRFVLVPKDFTDKLVVIAQEEEWCREEIGSIWAKTKNKHLSPSLPKEFAFCVFTPQGENRVVGFGRLFSEGTMESLRLRVEPPFSFSGLETRMDQSGLFTVLQDEGKYPNGSAERGLLLFQNRTVVRALMEEAQL